MKGGVDGARRHDSKLRGKEGNENGGKIREEWSKREKNRIVNDKRNGKREERYQGKKREIDKNENVRGQ